ncbi:hypothetical protein SLE2022_184590 [Rubroshorea leprosula]
MASSSFTLSSPFTKPNAVIFTLKPFSLPLEASIPPRYGGNRTLKIAYSSLSISNAGLRTGPDDLVASIISKVTQTDGGKYCVDEPVKNPLIFGEWHVVYCSRPTSPGGGYRSALGRLVFRTKEMVQVVESPDIVRNEVSFSALGFLDGEVSLKGKLKVLDDKWIQVMFRAPELKVGSLELRCGGASEVKLQITYIDEKIRLGKGSGLFQLATACGELPSSSHIVFLRFFNQTIDSIKLSVTQIFSSIFCCESNVDPCVRDEGPLTAIGELVKNVGDHYQMRTHDWFSRKKDCDDKGDPEAVFNVLDSMLEDSLERLKNMRESIPLENVGFDSCTLEAINSRHATLFRCLCSEGKWKTALWLRRKLIQKGAVLDVFAHNLLLNGLCKIRDMEKPDCLIREMLEMGPPPNLVTYNTFIKAHCLKNNVDKALYLFSTMATDGIRPNRVTCNTLVHALCKKGLVDDAKKLLCETLSDDNEKTNSDLITSTILMDCYFRSGDTVQALGFWDQMLHKNIQIDLVAYNVLIHGLCLGQHINVAYGNFAEILKRGFIPDCFTFFFFGSPSGIRGFAPTTPDSTSCGAPEWWVGLPTKTAAYTRSDCFTFNTLISALCKEGKVEEACHIHDVMLKMGVAPDKISYKMIIQGLCFRGDLVKAIEFLNSLLEKSLMPEPLIWNLIIDGYGRCGDLALYVNNHMLSLGVAPNEMLLNGLFPDLVTYNMLISAACISGHIAFALDLYDEMLRKGIEPDVITYTELIRGYCMRGNVKEAEKLLTKMRRSGLQIDHVPCKILIKKYCHLGQHDMAFDLYQNWLMREK